MRTLRALVLLTGTLAVRLLREPQIVRSLTFPTLLMVGTMASTMLIVVWVSGAPVVAVPTHETGLSRAIAAEGFTVVDAAPEDAVRAGLVWAGTDGRTLWLSAERDEELALERVIRTHIGADWRPLPRARVMTAANSDAVTGVLLRMIAGPFLLYGVVFGAGMVARDRDDGTLEAELALALPWWVHGAARLVASTVLLTTGYGVGAGLFHAYIGSEGVGAYLLHAGAAFAMAGALGLALIGRGGLRSGFAGPMAAGITAVTALVGLGLGAPQLGKFVPVASLTCFTHGVDGWVAPLLLSGAACIGACALFAARQRA